MQAKDIPLAAPSRTRVAERPSLDRARFRLRPAVLPCKATALQAELHGRTKAQVSVTTPVMPLAFQCPIITDRKGGTERLEKISQDRVREE